MIRNRRDPLRLEQFALVCSTENVTRSYQCSAICKVVRLVDVSVSQQQDKITPLTHQTQMNSSLLQILRNPYLLQNLDIRSMNEQVKKKKHKLQKPAQRARANCSHGTRKDLKPPQQQYKKGIILPALQHLPRLP